MHLHNYKYIANNMLAKRNKCPSNDIHLKD